MNSKQAREVDLVRRFFGCLGQSVQSLDCQDRPDIAHIELHCIGIEVTELNTDESLGATGSRLREAQENATRARGDREPAAWVGPLNVEAALAARIKRKIEKARTYDNGRYDELWLLVAAAVPDSGALAATMIFPPQPDLTTLNNATHAALCGATFAKAYLHIILGRRLFMWSRSTRWQQIP